jgi:hypothetical protein
MKTEMVDLVIKFSIYNRKVMVHLLNNNTHELGFEINLEKSLEKLYISFSKCKHHV